MQMINDNFLFKFSEKIKKMKQDIQEKAQISRIKRQLPSDPIPHSQLSINSPDSIRLKLEFIEGKPDEQSSVSYDSISFSLIEKQCGINLQVESNGVQDEQQGLYGDKDIEKSKRKFVKEILKITKGKSQTEKIEILNNKAKQFSITRLQAKLWVISYRLVFQIETNIKLNNSNETSSRQIYNFIIQTLKPFIRRNAQEKKETLQKIIRLIFQAFNFSDVNYEQLYVETVSQGASIEQAKINNDEKLKDLCENSLTEEKYIKQLSFKPQFFDDQEDEKQQKGAKSEKIASNKNKSQEAQNNKEREQEKIKKKKEKKKNNSEMGESTNAPKKEKKERKQAKRGKKHQEDKQMEQMNQNIQKCLSMAQINSQRNPREEQILLQNYPNDFKVKVAAKLDRAFHRLYYQFIQANAEELCLDSKVIQTIFKNYGSFFSSSDQIKPHLPVKPNPINDAQALPHSDKRSKSNRQIKQNNGLNKSRAQSPNGYVGGFFPQSQLTVNSNQSPFAKLQPIMLIFLKNNPHASRAEFDKYLLKQTFEINFQGSVKGPVLLNWADNFIRKFAPTLRQQIPSSNKNFQIKISQGTQRMNPPHNIRTNTVPSKLSESYGHRNEVLKFPRFGGELRKITNERPFSNSSLMKQ